MVATTVSLALLFLLSVTVIGFLKDISITLYAEIAPRIVVKSPRERGTVNLNRHSFSRSTSRMADRKIKAHFV